MTTPQDYENIFMEFLWMMQENCLILTSALCVIQKLRSVAIKGISIQ